MDKKKEIFFNNTQNPKSSFDIVRFEDIQKRQTTDHSPFDFHILKFYAIFFATEGKGYHYIDFHKYNCSKGTVLLIGDGQTHKFSEKSSLKGYILVFQNSFLAKLLSIDEIINILQIFNDSLFEPKIQLKDNYIDDIFNRIKNIKKEYFDPSDLFTDKIIVGEIYTLLSMLFRESKSVKNTTLNSKYLNSFLSLQELMKKKIFQTTKVFEYANSLGISTKTLNTVTKAIVGKQAKTYINGYYLLCVKKILINKNLSIKECAYQAGFDDIPNFYKFIRKHLNQTPEQFREES